MEHRKHTDPETEQIKENVRKHFSELAFEYHQRNYEMATARGKYPDIYMRHLRILEMLEGRPPGRILEIGVGGGQLLMELHARGNEVFGVDLSQEMLAAVVARGGNALAGSLATCDMENLCFRDGSLDAVVAAGVIEYLPSASQALAEISRVVREGGIVVLSIRNLFPLGRPLIALRNFFVDLPILKHFVRSGITLVQAVLRRKSDPMQVYARRDFPWRFRQDMRCHGLEPIQMVFYHFSIFPPALERTFPKLCIPIGVWLERFSQTPLGYIARGCIFMARKSGPRNSL